LQPGNESEIVDHKPGKAQRAVLYARVSYDDRGQDAVNLEGQLEACREYALDHGWQIVAELAEDVRGASGADWDLPQLKQILELAATGAIDRVVVREVSRLSRDLAKFMVIDRELRQAGVEISYVIEQFDDTPEGQLMKHVMASLADYARLDITRRMMRGRRQKVRRGKVIFHGHPPLGYHDVDGELVIVPEEAEIVKRIFDWYAEERIGVYVIARRLSEEGVLTWADRYQPESRQKRNRPGIWNASTIWKMINNETYAGHWTYASGDSVDVPAIVSRDQWQRAQRISRENRGNARRNLKYKYLLRRLVTCGRCGLKARAQARPYTLASGEERRNRYYRCSAAHTRYRHSVECRMPSFRADQLDPAVWKWLYNLLTEPEALDRLAAAQVEVVANARPRLQEDRDRIAALVDEKRAGLHRVLGLYIEGGIDKAELDEHRARLVGEIRQQEEALKALDRQLAENAQAAGALDALAKARDDAAYWLSVRTDNFENRRAAVEAMGLRVTLVDDGNGTRGAWVELPGGIRDWIALGQ
jgi:site-specific DNA recombinase